MGWKNLPYWLKGGIIGVVMGLLIGIFWAIERYHKPGPESIQIVGVVIQFVYIIILCMVIFGISFGLIGKIIDILKNKNNSPYWLKGGIIGCIIYFVILTLWFFVVAPISTGHIGISLFDKIISSIFGIFFFIPAELFKFFDWIGISFGGSPESSIAVILFPLISIIIGFIIGALIGFIFGKIKQRKESNK